MPSGMHRRLHMPASAALLGLTLSALGSRWCFNRRGKGARVAPAGAKLATDQEVVYLEGPKEDPDTAILALEVRAISGAFLVQLLLSAHPCSDALLPGDRFPDSGFPLMPPLHTRACAVAKQG